MNRQKLTYTIIGVLVFSTLFAFVFIKKNNLGPYYESSFLQDKSNVQKRMDDNNRLTYDRKNSITSAVQMVSPAVVGINVSGVQRYSNPYYRFMFGDQVVQELGSGVIISPDGFILTNDHVANRETTSNPDITVTLTDGTRLKANKIGADKFSDICLLKINAGKPLPYVSFGNSDDILIGEWAIALGNPFGLFDINDKPTVTVGVISATDMNMKMIDGRAYVDMLQTDAAINPGNSGGPLVNINGELIGLNSMIRGSDEGIQASIGLGFAIPVNKIKRIINELKEKGEIDRNYVTGLHYQEITDDIVRLYKLSTIKGVIVAGTELNSPAAKAGLQKLDIIVQVGKYKTLDVSAFQAVFFEFRTDEVIPVKIIRGKEILIKNMKLERVAI
jgi:serine protease Do